jgi:RNA polymerase sigma-70 factor (sigma-E family)
MNQDFREFARSRAGPLRRSSYLLCGDWHLADDLVQETLVKVYRHWDRVRYADDPDAYVRRILVNEVTRHWRRHRHTALLAEPYAEQSTSFDEAGGVTDRLTLLAALQQLGPRQRATVVLRYFEGLSERETAQALGCSQGTVKSQTSRALSILSTILQPEELSR